MAIGNGITEAIATIIVSVRCVDVSTCRCIGDSNNTMTSRCAYTVDNGITFRICSSRQATDKSVIFGSHYAAVCSNWCIVKGDNIYIHGISIFATMTISYFVGKAICTLIVAIRHIGIGTSCCISNSHCSMTRYDTNNIGDNVTICICRTR